MALRDLLDSDFVRARNVLPVVVALAFGVLAWFGVGPLLFGEGDEAPPPAPVPAPAPVAEVVVDAPAGLEPVAEPETAWLKFLVAVRDLGVGTLVRRDDVAWRERHEPVDEEAAFIARDWAELADVAGAVVVRPVAAGAPIPRAALVPPGGRGFLTAVLAPDARAVTVTADGATTSARIIYPGDRVDVIFVANNVPGPEGVGLAARRIVRDARVLAVGSDSALLGPGPFEGWLAPRPRSALQIGEVLEAVPVMEARPPPTGNTFTLEVSLRDAERLSLAGTAGQLTLAMRSVAAAAAFDPVWSAPVQLDEVVSAGPAEKPVRVLRGTQSESVARESLAAGAPRGDGASP